MNNRMKEAAKFLCGWEAFHAAFHAYFLVSDTHLTVLGITLTPTLNLVALVTAGVLSIALGIYGWRTGSPIQDRPVLE